MAFTLNSEITEEKTLMVDAEPAHVAGQSQECCLVQIYPADVIDGMVLMEQDCIVVGRDAKCQMRIEDTSVSRRHAEFVRFGDGYMVRDLGSTNGTFVNGNPVSEHVLQADDRIKIGSYIFKFLSAGSIETQYHETVYSAMTCDALTGASNKSYLLDNLKREIVRCTRHQRPMTLMMMDIDHFKSVNDTYGHLVGDEVLKEFGRRIAETNRGDDLFARYGGEEFALLLSETGMEEALDMGERARAVVAETPFQTSGGELEITCSFGIVELDTSTEQTPTDLIRIADERLYKAKQAGRNCVIGG